MRSGWSKLTVALAVAALGLAGCSETSTIAAPKTSGTVSIQLKDAPGAFQAAVVTISDIYLQGSDSTGSGARVHLLNAPVTTNLLTLSDSVMDLVQAASVPSGTYSQLRFVIDGAYIVVDNGGGRSSVYATQGYTLPDSLQATGTLKCPSCAQSGLKVTMPGSLTVNGDNNVVTVDFNVADSFGHQAGKSGMWIMHPTLKGTFSAAPPPPPAAGSVMVSVTLPDSVTLPTVNGQQVAVTDFQAQLTSMTDSSSTPQLMTLTGPDSTGAFTATFATVTPGDYAVDLVPPDSVSVTTDPVLPDSITVTAGQQTSVSTTITSATKTAPAAGSVMASFTLPDSVTLPTVNGQQVTLADFQAQLTSVPADSSSTPQLMTLTGPDSTGAFTATFATVTPGDYAVDLVPPDSVSVTTDPVLPDSITVTGGQQTSVSATVTSATKSGG